MKEQLVSLEAAWLLMNKGFCDGSHFYYCNEKEPILLDNGKSCYINGMEVDFAEAPTQTVAAKWLRDMHDINISVLRMTESYGGAVSEENMLKYFWHIQIPRKESIVDVGIYYDSFEKAMEAGICKALSLLIIKQVSALGGSVKPSKYMEPFIQRIVDEKTELDERAGKLGNFVNSEKFYSLDSEMQSLMVEQYDVMKRYSVILSKRIELLNA